MYIVFAHLVNVQKKLAQLSEVQNEPAIRNYSRTNDDEATAENNRCHSCYDSSARQRERLTTINVDDST
jgi:hypothetical protein